MAIKSTRCTVEAFERCAARAGLVVADRCLWLVNPHYETKFGLRPRRLCAPLAALPWVRNFFSTSCWYVLRLPTGCGQRYACCGPGLMLSGRRRGSGVGRGLLFYHGLKSLL